MSELINNSANRKDLLKHMILQLHEGVAPDAVRKRMIELMSKIPYGEVVEVEQELISEGLPEDEVLRLCDIHTEALDGMIDLSGMKVVPPGHPVDTFKAENRELEKVVRELNALFEKPDVIFTGLGGPGFANKMKSLFNALTDVDKHYRRKENLLFPFLEKYGITGPPKVMWGKHDETRGFLKNALNALDLPATTADMMAMKIELHLKPAAKAITDMIMKEEEILFPMTLDKLNESDWYEIYNQTNEIGYCLYDPQVKWEPVGITEAQEERPEADAQVKLPSGRFTAEELMAVFNTLPVDITFVDKNDKVKYFSQGRERIFDRNRAILGRDVRMCHPPASVHTVEQILSDFKSGDADSAPFWIQMQGKFIHIEYFALRNEKGEYLGTIEMSQDLTEKRSLAGDQRLLSYRHIANSEADKGGSMSRPEEESLKPKITLDARPLLAQGIHPLEQVIQQAGAMNPGEVFEIITPFPPSPMIEKMKEAGFEYSSESDSEGLYHTFFKKS